MKYTKGKVAAMKENKESDYEEQLNMVIEERLSKMEEPGYVFAKRFGKGDYIIIVAVVLISLSFLIIGAYL